MPKDVLGGAVVLLGYMGGQARARISCLSIGYLQAQRISSEPPAYPPPDPISSPLWRG